MKDSIFQKLRSKKYMIPIVIISGFVVTLILKYEYVKYFALVPVEISSYVFPFVGTITQIVLFIPESLTSIVPNNFSWLFQYLLDSVFMIFYFAICIFLFKLYPKLGENYFSKNSYNDNTPLPFKYSKPAMLFVLSIIGIVICLDAHEYNLRRLIEFNIPYGNYEHSMKMLGEILLKIIFVIGVIISVCVYIKHLKYWGLGFGTVMMLFLFFTSMVSFLMFYYIKCILSIIYLPLCILYGYKGETKSGTRSYANRNDDSDNFMDYYVDSRPDSNNHYHYLGDGDFIDDNNNIVSTYKDINGEIRRVDNNEKIQKF